MSERVTLTGIDEYCNTGALIRVARRFPFVELAVLAGSEEGTPRMPQAAWIRAWSEQTDEAGVGTTIHLCGERSRMACRYELGVDRLLNGSASGGRLRPRGERDQRQRRRGEARRRQRRRTAPGRNGA